LPVRRIGQLTRTTTREVSIIIDMSAASGLWVSSVQKTLIDGQPGLQVNVDSDAAKDRRLDGKQTVKVWNSTLPHGIDSDAWATAKRSSSRRVWDKDGPRSRHTIVRYVAKIALPGVDLDSVDVASIARLSGVLDSEPDWNKKFKAAQDPHQNFRAGYRLYAGPDLPRTADGRFVQVDGAKLVKDVGSLKRCSKVLTELFGDKSVDELRAAFGGKSVSQIRAQLRRTTRANRAAMLSAALGRVPASLLSLAAPIVGAESGTSLTSGAPLA
jgi:hypothetical protein